MLLSAREKTIFDAHDLFCRKKYTKSLAVCEEIYATNMDSYSSLNLIAEIYLKRDDFGKAEQYLFKLIDHFRERGLYDHAIAIVKKLLKIKPDNEEYIRLIAKIFKDAGRENLMVRQLFKLAEIYRFEGKFDKCASLYGEISDMFDLHPDLDRKIIKRLSIIGHVDTIVRIALKNHEAKSFEDEELDDVVLLCAESGHSAPEVISFIPGFLERNVGALSFVEDIIFNHLRLDYSDDFLNKIIESAGYMECENLLLKLKEEITELNIFKYLLAIESEKGNRDKVKGLVYELYIENLLDLKAIEDVSFMVKKPFAFEEAIKIDVDFLNDSEIFDMLRVLEQIYIKSGDTERAESLAVYIKYSKLPNLSKFISNPPEAPVSIEARLDKRTVVAQAKVEIQETVPEEHVEDETPVSEKNMVEIETFQTDSEEAVSGQEIELSDDYGENGDTNIIEVAIDGIETFEKNDESIVESEILTGLETFEFSETDSVNQAEEEQVDFLSGFEGNDTGNYVDAEPLSGFGEDEEVSTSEQDDIFENLLEQSEDRNGNAEPEKIDISDIELEEKEEEDIFAGLEIEEKQSEETEEQEKIKLDEKDKNSIKKNDSDIFDMEID
jgi:tetratricopeptide (TPR) repeat protein